MSHGPSIQHVSDSLLVATWNVNSLNARLVRVVDWLDEVGPDIVCLQETKLADDAFPVDAFTELGYELAIHGQGQWNGVAIASRVGLSNQVNGFAAGIEADPDARLVTATCAGVQVSSVYVPNGREVGHEHYRYKLSWLTRLVDHLNATTSPNEPVVVAGDWNIAPDDRDVWDPAAFEGHTHVTDEERQALAAIKDWGLVDTFRQRYQDGGLYSFYDYQAGRFHKRQGIRIDFVLASEPLADRCRLDLVDRNARKGTKPSYKGAKPSDHAPVLARYQMS